MFIERVKCLVFVLKKVLELLACGVVEGLVSKFIANLPTDDVGIVTEALRQRGRNLNAELTIARACIRELPAAAVLADVTICIRAKSVRILCSHPRGWRIGRSTNHDRDMMFLG